MIRRHALLEREDVAGIHNDSSMLVIAYQITSCRDGLLTSPINAQLDISFLL